MEEPATKHSKHWKPIIHFFLLGFVVFGLKAWFEKPDKTTPDRHLIEITTSDLEWFRAMFRKRMGRDPFAEELRAQVDQLIKEQVMSREAVKLGLDKNDDLIRRRLAQKMDYFLRDVVSGLQPTDEELASYLHANRERYEIAGDITFEQVLFKTNERGKAGAELALAMFLDHPNRDGDPTMLPRMNEKQSVNQIRGVYGSDFMDNIQSLENGKWHGPVHSSFGLHAVFIHEHSPSTLPGVEDIRDRLVSDWQADKQAEVSDEAYKALLDQYSVLLEGMPYDVP